MVTGTPCRANVVVRAHGGILPVRPAFEVGGRSRTRTDNNEVGVRCPDHIDLVSATLVEGPFGENAVPWWSSTGLFELSHVCRDGWARKVADLTIVFDVCAHPDTSSMFTRSESTLDITDREAW